MLYKITMPEGVNKNFSGQIHDMCPIEFKDGVGYVDVDFFPPRWRTVLVMMVGEPIIEECVDAIVIKEDDVVEVEIVSESKPKKRRGRRRKSNK